MPLAFMGERSNIVAQSLTSVSTQLNTSLKKSRFFFFVSFSIKVSALDLRAMSRPHDSTYEARTRTSNRNMRSSSCAMLTSPMFSAVISITP